MNLLDRVPEKEMAIVVQKDVYGPYKVSGQMDDGGDLNGPSVEVFPAITTVNIPFDEPSEDDPLILGK